VDLADADAIVVPGVGHFQATAALGEDWRAAVRERCTAGTPLLGVCLGMQWLYEGSDEAPDVPGLGLLEGRCAHLRAFARADAAPVKVPHVGWNALQTVATSQLLQGVADEAYVYFTHSYAAPVTTVCVARTDHGGPFAAVVERRHIFGVQFHPEKSGEVGLRLLRNFVAIADQTPRRSRVH
jgi:glutamine amidotransferase